MLDALVGRSPLQASITHCFGRVDARKVQNVMQASMYNLQSLLCFMFHCCVQLERRADFPDDEVDVLFLKRHKIG